MRIINPKITKDLERGEAISLNLGCGQRSVPGFYGLDSLALPGVDIIADLNEPLKELPDNSVAEVYSRHTLEHVQNFVSLLGELHRIVQPGGKIRITVPHFSNPYGYSDPTHVRYFGLYTFFYFADESDQPRRKVPTFYSTYRFKIENITIKLLKASAFSKLIFSGLEWVLNCGFPRLDWYERHLCWSIPAEAISYTLHVKKSPALPPKVSDFPLAKSGTLS